MIVLCWKKKNILIIVIKTNYKIKKKVNKEESNHFSSIATHHNDKEKISSMDIILAIVLDSEQKINGIEPKLAQNNIKYQKQ